MSTKFIDIDENHETPKDSHEELEQMKGEIEIKVEKDTIDEKEIRNLKQNVEKAAITSSIEMAQKSLQTDIKIDILEDKEAFFEFTEMIKDIFPEIEDQDMEDCLDEIEKYRKILGSRMNSDYLRTLLIHLQKSKTQNKDNIEDKEDKNNINLAELLHQEFLNETLENYENENNPIANIQSQFALFLYTQQQYQIFDDKKKEKMKQRLDSLIALYKEGKLIEIYEIQIDENGNITIKGRVNGQDVTITYQSQSDDFSVTGNQ